MNPTIRALVVALVFSVALAGCAGKSAPEFNAKYYPDCYDPIDKLCKDQSNREEVTGAVTGGLLGALGGAIIGGLTTGKVEGALVGAGVGAAAGAVTGFFAARLNKIQDQEQRLAEYQKILGEQSNDWDLETASVEKAYQCYSKQIKLLQAGYKSKQVTREAFLERAAEIKAGIEHINTYWADAQHRMDSRLAEGESWLANEDRQLAMQQNNAHQRSMRIAQQKRANTVKSIKAKAEKANNIKSTTNTELASLNILVNEASSYAQAAQGFPLSL